MKLVVRQSVHHSSQTSSSEPTQSSFAHLSSSSSSSPSSTPPSLLQTTKSFSQLIFQTPPPPPPPLSPQSSTTTSTTSTKLQHNRPNNGQINSLDRNPKERGRRRTVNTGTSIAEKPKSPNHSTPSNVPTSYSMFNFGSSFQNRRVQSSDSSTTPTSFDNSSSSLSSSSFSLAYHQTRKSWLALSIVRKDPVHRERVRALRSQQGFSLDPYAEAGFRFHALNGHKVLGHSECHISPFSALVPKAFVALLCTERFLPLALDKQRVESKLIRIEKLILQSDASAIDTIPTLELQTKPLPPYDKLMLMAEKARLITDSYALDQLTEILGGYLKCKDLHGQMLRMANIDAVSMDQCLGDGDQSGDLKDILSPIDSFRSKSKYLLKRSTKKKEAALKFVPTNLNIQVLHVCEKEASSITQKRRRQGPFSKVGTGGKGHPKNNGFAVEFTDKEFGVEPEEVSSFISMTLGCPAAHSFGYKQGGLRRMLGRYEGDHVVENVPDAVLASEESSDIIDNDHFGQNKKDIRRKDATLNPDHAHRTHSNAKHPPLEPPLHLSSSSPPPPPPHSPSAVTTTGMTSTEFAYGGVGWRLDQCRRLSDWSIPKRQLKKLAYHKSKWHKEKQLMKEREHTFKALAKLRFKEQQEKAKKQEKETKSSQTKERTTDKADREDKEDREDREDKDESTDKHLIDKKPKKKYSIDKKKEEEEFILKNFDALPSRRCSYFEESEIDLSYQGSILLSHLSTVFSPTDHDSIPPVASDRPTGLSRAPSQQKKMGGLRSLGTVPDKPLTPEERRHQWSDILLLVQRLDATTSQILAAAIAQVSSLVASAVSGSGLHKHILPRVLEAGFLFSIQSLLSTRGDELGMLEDMVVASEWLNSVTVRLIAKKKTTTPTNGTDKGTDKIIENNNDETHDENIEKEEETEEEEDDEEDDDDEELSSDVGSSDSTPCVFTRRNKKTGGLVIDLEIDEQMTAVVIEALKFSQLNGSYHPPSSSLSSRSASSSNPAMPKRRVSSQRSFQDIENELSSPSSPSSRPSSLSSSKSQQRKHSSAFIPDRIGAGDSTWCLIASFPIISVLFQQGINEQQAVSNAISAKALLFQSTVNRDSLERLDHFLGIYKDVSINQAFGGRNDIERELTNWDDGFDSLKRSIFNQLKINVHIILHASNLCRQLSGTHAICCKSGKDRTSMLVSLEEARLLCDHMRVVGGRKACKDMRRFGVRRENVEINTGQRKYAFNDVQRIFLPKCFQPPQGTYSGNAMT